MAAELVQPGSVIDERYELISLLGSGGFGVVYKAKQLTTGQLVAIKIARTLDEKTSSGVVARFKREMSVVAELSHPNIVRLIDTGQLPDKRLFAVLQLVRGVSLSECLQKEGPLTPTEAKHLMMQVLDALCSAHDLGVIHRDLKPANIMVTNVGARRNALVLDFGIATFTRGMRDESYQSLTPVGAVGGTPSYMAPEQLHGREPNPQTDIYAWGLVFLECLTGERVVRGNSIAETMFAHLRPEPHPLPPSLAAHPLGRILRTAVAKDPTNRYPDARAALGQLGTCDVSALRKLPGPQRPVSSNAETAMETKASVSGADQANFLSATALKLPSSRPPEGFSSLGGQSTPSPTQNVMAERRQLTSLACEIGPLAVLSESLEPDELYGIIGEFRRIANASVQNLDGVIDRWEGGRLICYFGYPVAHEDDASRAVQAALEILRDTAALEVELAEGAPPLGVQIGIHSGLVVTSNIHLGKSGEVSIVGDVSRIAVRLQESTEPNTVLLSDEVHRLVSDRFECVPEGTRNLGPKGSLSVYRALGIADATSLSSMSEMPTIGRESELASLADRWEEVTEGRGQVVLVSGEAGIGKSHLVAAFRDHIRDSRHFWLECLSSPYLRASAFHPLIHALSILFGFQRDDQPATKRKKIAAFLDAHGVVDREQYQGFLFALFELDDASGDAPLGGGVFKQPAEEQLLEFVFALAEERPVVISLEDLHWTDPSTLEFVHLLVDQAPLGAIFVLSTTRPSYMPDWRARSHVTPIPLSRLSRRRVESMVRAVAGHKTLPDELVRHLAAKTDGVPLFVEELTKAVLESELVIERDDRYEFEADVHSLAIPVSLRGSLMARLDRLGPVKEIAQIAAVVGREFSFGLLASVCELVPADLSQALHQLVQSELVIQRGRPPEAKYIFKHALVQDTAYESLLDKTRRRYHARIAEVLEEQFPEVGQSQPELLAHHYTEAKQDDKAIAYWLRAGTRASERSAHAESIQHLNKGLEILRKQPEGRERDTLEIVLVMSLGAPLMSTRGYGASEVEQNFSRALELCRRLGDADEHVPALWGLWVFYHVRAEYANALELGEQLYRLAERSGDAEIALSAHQAYGSSLLLTGEFERGREHFERGLAIYEPETHDHMAFVYGQDPGMYCHVLMSWGLFSQGYPDRAAKHAETSIEIARRVEHPNSIAFAMCMALPVFEQRGDIERVRELARPAMEVCREYRLAHWLAFAKFMSGLAHAATDLRRGIEQMRTALGDWRATGARIILPYFHSLLAERLGQGGHVEEGLEVQTQVSSANHNGDEKFFECTWQRVHAQLLIQRDQAGDKEQARQLLTEATQSARQRGDRMAEVAALTTLIELAQQQGTEHSYERDRLTELIESIHEGRDIPLLQRAQSVV